MEEPCGIHLKVLKESADAIVSIIIVLLNGLGNLEPRRAREKPLVIIGLLVSLQCL